MSEPIRILIAGGPATGKTQLAYKFAKQFGAKYMRTERLLGHGFAWSELSQVAQTWLAREGPWVIEGMTVPRIIRRYMRDKPGNAIPATEIWWLGTEPRRVVTPGQQAAAKAVETVWNEVAAQMRKHASSSGVSLYDRHGQMLPW